jgi:hypothetical protein
MTKGMKKYQLYLLLVASIGLGFNHALGFVHCQSEDGHHSLELIGNACCHAETIDPSPDVCENASGKTFFTKRDGCGPCVDTLISFYAVNAPKKTTPSISTVAAVPGFLNMISGCYGDCKSVPRSRLRLPINPSLLSIRTIILLA